MPAIQSQRSLFEAADVEVTRPEPKTTVQVGTRVAEIPLARKRKAALLQLMPILKDLEGKDIYVGSYWNSHNHFWANNLKLGRLQLEIHKGGNDLPSVIVLWGSREASVRIFTDQLISVRQQDYQGYTLWLLDFWNGTWEHPIDQYRPRGYVSLNIARFKD